MAQILLWLGLVFILALAPALSVLGLHPDQAVFALIGGVLMVIGIIILIFNEAKK